MTKAALDAVDSKYAQKQRNLMVAMQEIDGARPQDSDLTSYADVFDDTPRMGAGQ